jgi:hypothetical protein
MHGAPSRRSRSTKPPPRTSAYALSNKRTESQGGDADRGLQRALRSYQFLTQGDRGSEVRWTAPRRLALASVRAERLMRELLS